MIKIPPIIASIPVPSSPRTSTTIPRTRASLIFIRSMQTAIQSIATTIATIKPTVLPINSAPTGISSNRVLSKKRSTTCTIASISDIRFRIFPTLLMCHLV